MEGPGDPKNIRAIEGRRLPNAARPIEGETPSSDIRRNAIVVVVTTPKADRSTPSNGGR